MIEPFATGDVETKLLSHWAKRVPDEIDLTDERQDALVREFALEMLDRFAGDDELSRFDERLAGQQGNVPVLVRLAAKLARSRQLVAALGGGFHLSVVFAVFKEHQRLRTRSEHELGEDLLLRKIDQVEWLLADVPGSSWDMVVVDDGCPEGSGRIAQRILESRYRGGDVQVLFLERGIAAGHPATRGLRSTEDSQKGGSIQYGMAVATERSRPRHVVVFTDADLSTHLGQLGLLAHPILAGGWDAAIGSRREPSSVAVKSGARDARGKLFIYLWKRLIPALSQIVDTQCGFKAFRADVARRIAFDTLEKRFAFDVELLLKTELARRNSIVKVPIAWIDSEAASTTAALQPYLPMLRSIVQISRTYLPQTDSSSEFASFVDTLDDAAWKRLVRRLPAEIAERDPAEFDCFDGVTVAQLRSLTR
jgi:glycosyltransferase involved in cell wall biosynthesis